MYRLNNCSVELLIEREIKSLNIQPLICTELHRLQFIYTLKRLCRGVVRYFGGQLNIMGYYRRLISDLIYLIF